MKSDRTQASMTSMLRAAVVLGAFVGAAAVAQQAHISPELHPKSDEKFFLKDYPKDTRPPVVKEYFGFKHPYPIVQESKDYDKDYVKDENGDGGEWAAQEVYDTLRNKIPKQQQIMKDALKAEQDGEYAWKHSIDLEKESEKSLDELKKQLADAKKAAAEADRKVGVADAAAHKAEQDAKDKAEADGKDIEGAKGEVAKDKADAEKAGKDGGEGAKGDEADGAAGDSGEAEEKSQEQLLKECKEELAVSKQKLEKLKWEKLEHEKQLEAERKGLEYEKVKWDGAKAAAERLEGDAKKSLDHLTFERAGFERENESALKSVAQKEDVRRVQKELDDAAQTLRDFRKQEAGHGGGIYNKPKPIVPPPRSGAAMLYPSITALAGLAVLAW